MGWVAAEPSTEIPMDCVTLFRRALFGSLSHSRDNTVPVVKQGRQKGGLAYYSLDKVGPSGHEWR